MKKSTNKKAAELRRKDFVEAYLQNGGNATQAAIKAGYSPKTAKMQGSRLLTCDDVSRAIKRRFDKVVNKYELNTEMVVRSIVQEVTFDPVNLYHPDGRLKEVTELDEDTRMALAALEVEQRGGEEPVTVRKVRWAGKHQAREQAMKFLGMFEKDNRQRSVLADLPREDVKKITEHLAKLARGRD